MLSKRIITLMFHRINDVTLSYTPTQFEKYLKYLVENFPIILPGDAPQNGTNICLTFDDGYFDFYQDVFPLLKKYKIKAILAVPAKYIIDKATQMAATRLSVPYAHDMENKTLQNKQPFCSWEELKEMQDSQLVEIASHGYRHANLANSNTDLVEEIITSKSMIEQKLNRTIRYFVYPFGAMNATAHKMVAKNYEFGIRIGSALNMNWDKKKKFVYRINADPLWTQNQPITKGLIAKLTLKYWANRLRNK